MQVIKTSSLTVTNINRQHDLIDEKCNKRGVEKFTKQLLRKKKKIKQINTNYINKRWDDIGKKCIKIKKLQVCISETIISKLV